MSAKIPAKISDGQMAMVDISPKPVYKAME